MRSVSVSENYQVPKVAFLQDRISVVLDKSDKLKKQAVISIFELSKDKVVINLSPVEHNGLNGANYYGDFWSYETRTFHKDGQRLPVKGSGLPTFGRTVGHLQKNDDGSLTITVHGPFEKQRRRKRAFVNHPVEEKLEKATGDFWSKVDDFRLSKAKPVVEAVPEDDRQPSPAPEPEPAVFPPVSLENGETLSLRDAVKAVNRIKSELGESLILTINEDNGKLRALVEYGG